MIEMNDPIRFFGLQSAFAEVPFTQSEAWYNYLKAQGKRITFFSDDSINPSIMTWGIAEKIPLSKKKILRIEGECCHDFSADSVRDFYGKLEALPYVGIELNSNTFYQVDFEINLRRAGFVRPLGSFSCPLTIVIDLEKTIDYNRNWKRNVKTAEKEQLVISELQQPARKEVEQIVSLFGEMAELKNLGYSLSASALMELVQSNTIRTFMAYTSSNEPLAARIVFVSNGFASDVIAANSNRARECGAVFLLMQHIFETLGSEQIKAFDFSRIPPSTHASDSVYLFKNATRGKKMQYNGEWVRYKRKRTELMVFVYKWLKLKKQRY